MGYERPFEGELNDLSLWGKTVEYNFQKLCALPVLDRASEIKLGRHKNANQKSVHRK